jgi:hypothetical protein
MLMAEQKTVQNEQRKSTQVSLKTLGAAFLLFLPLGFFFVFFGIQNWLSKEASDSLNVWLQFLIGNWPNWQAAAIDNKSLGFSIAVAIRFTLAYTAIGSLFAVLFRLQRSWRFEIMQYRDLLKDRDVTMITFIEQELPEEQRTDDLHKLLTRAVAACAKSWEEEQLPALLADRALARRVIEREVPQG